MSPVSLGQKLKGEIVAIGDKGDPIIKVDNFAIIVPCDRGLGHTVEFHVVRVFAKFAIGVEFNKEVDREIK